MHLLKTINLETGEFYFTKFFGTRSSLAGVCDPENKFKVKTAADGSKSVVTTLINTYGTQQALTLAYEAHVEANKKNSLFKQKSIQTKIESAKVVELIEDNKVEVLPELQDDPVADLTETVDGLEAPEPITEDVPEVPTTEKKSNRSKK